MQAPFEESMLEATGETGYVPFANPTQNIDARQEKLCKAVEAVERDWNFTYNCHWRTHPRGKFHPLLKTLAQIVFGVHLLHQQLQKSVGEVADILLKHVNELDSFLQRANEDIEGSLKDMLFRRKCLKVPMEHVNEFDRLLDDRTYRAQLLDGNVTIERTINRMSILLNDYLIDMATFRDANNDLDLYLRTIGNAWVVGNDDVAAIYGAMCGNTSGWSQVLQSLVAKAEKLGVVLVQVSSYCNEIEKRCGAASRRSLIASRSSSRSTNSRDAARSFRNFADNKPLPNVPNERPPFMASPSSSSEPSIVEELSQVSFHKQQNSGSNPAGMPQVHTIAHSDSEESLHQRGRQMQPSTATSTQTSRSDVTVIPEDYRLQPRYYQDESPSQDQHQPLLVQESNHSAVSVPQQQEPASHPEPLQKHGHNRGKPRRIITDNEKGETPPLTGKDSAYSSVSGGSFASPTNVLPRSASAQGSYPRAQFGLFPSSSPSTPKRSVSGRHGALSPVDLMSPKLSPKAKSPENAPPQPAPRSQSAFDNYSSSSRRLLKKSSLSSLKRLFSKKKHPVDSIAE
jgi:hypothetical protein